MKKVETLLPEELIESLSAEAKEKGSVELKGGLGDSGPLISPVGEADSETAEDETAEDETAEEGAPAAEEEAPAAEAAAEEAPSDEAPAAEASDIAAESDSDGDTEEATE